MHCKFQWKLFDYGYTMLRGKISENSNCQKIYWKLLLKRYSLTFILIASTL